jgi:hypothetical protein
LEATGGKVMSPTSPPAMCTDCGKAAIQGSRHCQDHQENNQEIDNRRLSSRWRRENDPLDPLYKTARWSATRRRVWMRDPLCVVCQHKAATIADHIVKARVYIAQHGGDLNAFFDESNLQGLCKRDHDLKTRRGE